MPIQKKIKNDLLEEALEEMELLLDQTDNTNLKNEHILHSSRLKRNNTNTRKGLRSPRESERERIRISHALLEFWEEMKKAGIIEKTEVESPQTDPFPKDQLRILFLAANPNKKRAIPVGREYDLIKDAIQRSNYRDRINFVSKLDLTTYGLPSAINEHRPHILHFTAHGVEDGLWLSGHANWPELYSGEKQKNLIALFPSIECVILNACTTHLQAALIAKVVPNVIAMKDKIETGNSALFSSNFYTALGGDLFEFGKFDYFKAYQIALSAMAEAHKPEEDIPTYFKNGEPIA